MDYFIEVTEKNSGDKILVPVPIIKSVFIDDDGVTVLEMSRRDDCMTGWKIRETYDEVKCKLTKAAVVI